MMAQKNVLKLDLEQPVERSDTEPEPIAIPMTRKRSTTVTSPLPPGLQRRLVPRFLRMTRKEDLEEKTPPCDQTTSPQEPLPSSQGASPSAPSRDAPSPRRRSGSNPQVGYEPQDDSSGINQLDRDVIAAAEIMTPTCKASYEMRRILASDIDIRERTRLREKRGTRQLRRANSPSESPEREDDMGDKVGLLSMTRESDDDSKGARVRKGKCIKPGVNGKQSNIHEMQKKCKRRGCCHRLFRWLLCGKNSV